MSTEVAIFFVIGILLLIGVARAHSAETQVVSHWARLLDGLSESPQQFYDFVETAIVEREVPKAKGVQIFIREGNLLTSKRMYFEIRRGENKVILCGAPFGRGFFVSWWLIVPP